MLHFMNMQILIQMWLACQKKNYLVCVEMTNLRIFTQPLPIFFQSTKLRQTTEDRDSWKILSNNSEILTSTQVKYLFFWHANHISDKIAITCCVNFSARFTKFIANVRFFFLMAVLYMIFKYGKRFRFSPSFN